MTKFHLSANGPAVCNATKRPCPLGGEEIHFESRDAADTAFAEKLTSEAKPLTSHRKVREIDPLVLAREAKIFAETGDSYLWGSDWNGVSDNHSYTLEEFSDEDKAKTGLALAEALHKMLDSDGYYEDDEDEMEDIEEGVIQKRLSSGEVIYAVREMSQTSSAYYTIIREHTTFSNLYGRDENDEWLDDEENDLTGLVTKSGSINISIAGRITDAAGWLNLDVDK